MRDRIGDRKIQNSLEREMCKAISQAIHGQMLQTLSNTRCINSELLVNAARTAKTNLDAVFSKFNPLSVVLQEFLANADSNEEYQNWDAIRAIRSMWPERSTLANCEAKILGLTNIDNRIEQGLLDPDSLAGTSYLNKFGKRKQPVYAARKRKWQQAGREWDANMESDQSQSEFRGGEG